METIIKFNRIVSYCSPIIVIIYLIVVASVLLATFNFGLGTELSFNQCVAVCMYTSLPGIIKALLAILVILLGATGNFTFQNPIASNLSGLVDPSSHFLYSLFISIDVFTIWTLLLAGIAFSCLTKVKRGTCLAVVFGWWLVFILAASGLGSSLLVRKARHRPSFVHLCDSPRTTGRFWVGQAIRARNKRKLGEREFLIYTSVVLVFILPP